MSQQQNILVVEDDQSLAQWISDYLTDHGYQVTVANRGDVAVELIQADVPDLVVLDIMLPVKNGFDVCKEVRAFYPRPILILTACTEESDEVVGLELGADDYLSKPVKPRVLLARIKALLRRASPIVDKHVLTFGSLSIDGRSNNVSIDDVNVVLSSNEFDVLWLLAKNAGVVITRTELVSQLRGINYDGFDRSIDIRISRLRKKLGDDASKPFKIKTIWAKGYLFAPDAW